MAGPSVQPVDMTEYAEALMRNRAGNFSVGRLMAVDYYIKVADMQ